MSVFFMKLKRPIICYLAAFHIFSSLHKAGIAESATPAKNTKP